MISLFELFIAREEIKVLLLSPSMMVFNCFFRLIEAEKLCISEESLSAKRASGFVARCKPFVLEKFRKQILRIA